MKRWFTEVKCPYCEGTGLRIDTDPTALRLIRKENGWRLHEAGRELGLSKSYLSRIETGKCSCPLEVERFYFRLSAMPKKEPRNFIRHRDPKRTQLIFELNKRGIRKNEIARRFGLVRQRIDQILSPEKQLARRKRNGELKPLSACEGCKKPGYVEAHHPNYKEPDRIEWLCRACHGKTRRGKRQK